MSQSHALLQSVAPPPERPSPDSWAGRYVRSFLFMRTAIGALGVSLPFFLVLGDWMIFDGDPVPRDSLSAYYYSGMREVFVLFLGTIGFFLIAYKVTEKNLDNSLSFIAGMAAITVPLFPTGRSSELESSVALTPLQDWMGEGAVQGIHFAAAATFIGGCGAISVLFGMREAERPAHDARCSPIFWRNFHFACSGVIGVAVLWILATSFVFDGPTWSLLLGEAVAAWAFGASWFMKGYEIRYLLGKSEK